MRARLLEKLRCPNTGAEKFVIYARELVTEAGTVAAAEHVSITADSDVRTGILVQPESGCVYPIDGHVLSMLSDEDADLTLYEDFLQRAAAWAPAAYQSAIAATLERIRAVTDAGGGRWNREEMAYYDRAVATEELRAGVLKRMESQPLWHIYLERDSHLFAQLKGVSIRDMLEIGSGNSRTVRWLLRPAVHHFNYIGTDISFKRLLLARMAIPEADFVQCSALNLPFRAGAFTAVLALGMLHHLSDPPKAAREAVRTLANDGRFLFTEPIARPVLLKEGNWNWLRRAFTTYQHSEHDGKLDIAAITAALRHEGLRLDAVHYTGSLLRTVISRGLDLYQPLRRSRRVWQALLRLDAAFNLVFCQSPNAFGPKNAFMTWSKPSRPPVFTSEDAGAAQQAFAR